MISVGNFVGGGAALDGAATLKRVRIGNYDVAVVQAATGAQLNRWLATNGFADLPPTGMAAADAYGREGWVFVAARLTTSGTGLKAPHPLKLVFPAAAPVYPMRLTAMADRGTDAGECI